MTRTGKIARLPQAIRQELNQRLYNGEPGKRLVAWLNSLPAVQAVMESEFEGQPVLECNLSRWKQGGYKAWQEVQEMREAAAVMMEEAPELPAPTRKALSNRVAARFIGELIMQLQKLDAMREGRKKARRQRDLFDRFVALRRGDLDAERLGLEQKRVDFHERRFQHQQSGKIPLIRTRLRSESPEENCTQLHQIAAAKILNKRLTETVEQG